MRRKLWGSLLLLTAHCSLLTFLLLTAFPALGKSLQKETLTVTTGAAVSLTQSVYLPGSGPLAGKYARRAVITVEDNSVRYWVNGAAPTAALGHLAYVGAVITLKDDEIVNFLAIGVSGTAKLQVSYDH